MTNDERMRRLLLESTLFNLTRLEQLMTEGQWVTISICDKCINKILGIWKDNNMVFKCGCGQIEIISQVAGIKVSQN